jgi:membrane protease YdiL (CAAX protease family)
MINPEDNDIAALAVGAIAPCVCAPWWEEVLYRGFMLPALTLFMPTKVAIPVSAVLFAVSNCIRQCTKTIAMYTV